MQARLVQILAVATGCRHTSEPTATAHSAAPPTLASRVDAAPPEPPAPRLPRVLVGETCLNAALRGPHLFPLFAGGDVSWTADESIARAPVTAAPHRFVVLGFDGEVHGHLITTHDQASSDPRGFLGEYQGVWGVGPCTYRQPGGATVIRVDCGAAGGCGISIAASGAPEDPFTRSAIATKIVCAESGSLVADLDGDGALEAYSLEGFRGDDAIEGRPAAPGCSTPRFAWYRLPAGADMIDILGVADLDRDSNLEVLVAHTAAGGARTVTLYTPGSGPGHRLERRASVVR